MQKKTTIKDIAKKCGVSLMAVSRALNNKRGISSETTERIRAAARELNYSPNLIAKSLRVNETRTLGVIVSDSSAMLIDKMLQGIGDAAKAAGYSIVFTNTNRIRENEGEAIQLLVSKRIDGLLLAAPLQTDEESLSHIRQFGVPFVTIMRVAANADSVVSDNYGGARTMVEHLIATGSDRVVAISLPRDYQIGRDRLRGYRDAMKNAGLPVRAGDVHYSPPFIDDGKRAMAKILDKGFKKGAVFCGCDMIAIGAMHCALSRGVRIPDDLRVCGYDGIDMLDYMEMPLTTIHQPVYAMGKKAVSLLLQRIRYPNREYEIAVMPGELIIRRST